MDLNIGKHEKNFVIDSVHDGIRNDGRRLLDYRPMYLEIGVLCGANGSSRVKIGETDVLIGIKSELASSDKEEIDNRLRFYVDFSMLASTSYDKKTVQEFSEQLVDILSSAYDNREAFPDLDNLLISPTHAWILHVDAVVLQIDGNAIDAISLGIKAALADTKICNVVKRPADEGKSKIFIAKQITCKLYKVHIDLPEESTTWSPDFSKAPLVISVSKIGDYCVIDPTSVEEKSSTTTLLVAVMPNSKMTTLGDGDFKISSVKKFKGGTLDTDSIEHMLSRAKEAAKLLDKTLIDSLKITKYEKDALVSDASIFSR